MGNCSSAPTALGRALEVACGCGKTKDKPPVDVNGGGSSQKTIRGTVVLMKKNVLDFNDSFAGLLDRVHEFFGKGVSLQLVSAVHCDPEGKVGKPAYLEKWVTMTPSVTAGDVSFDVTFEWDEEAMGTPGALIVRNHHHSEFYLKTVTLHDVVRGRGEVHFLCNSWVYPAHRYNIDRVFFSNETYLPSNTPEPLQHYRKQELINLQGTGSGQLKEWDRVYDYDCYNDLGMPEKGPDYCRQTLGGCKEYPYPRRGELAAPQTKLVSNHKCESRLPLLSLDIYVPRDERFSQVKMSDFLAYALKSIGQVVVPESFAVFDKTINEFDTFQDVLDIYRGGIKLPDGVSLDELRQCIPWEMVKELTRSDGERFLKFPVPAVIKEDRSAWRTDEEFAREMLAGVNPVCIRRLREFPPASKLDPRSYGDQTSSITRKQVEPNMNGLTVDQAIEANKLYILDHHDTLMPYLRRINDNTSTKTYASRTILLLQVDGTLRPLAIELSSPHPLGDLHGCISQVFTPAQDGVKGSVWQLAKAYVAVNDSGVHQLVSHWLNTHAVIEPFVIATHRQLNTMYINAMARQILINAGGVLERTVFPAKYALEMCAVIYKDWNFCDQALPADLLKRGMAVPDPTQPCGLRLQIEDYPFAVDGLEIWSAIERWVGEYCSFYYPRDDLIQDDSELQQWWEELKTRGHGDKMDELWWPKMETKEDLIKTCTIIIWIASALHAAINFGQYPYAGYLPNRPTVSRRLMPEPNSLEYAELESNPDVAFLKTITAQLQPSLDDEVYLGQRDTDKWTTDERTLEAFDRFGKKLIEIENRIMDRNKDQRLKNRFGPARMPYTLLYPSTSDSSNARGLLAWESPILRCTDTLMFQVVQ
ncbi:Linoleate 9S-lipoxygenase [Bertholletia excelsa]